MVQKKDDKPPKVIIILIKKWLWLFVFTLLCILFLFLTSEVLESDAGQPELVGDIDKIFLSAVHKFREPGLTAIAIDITALGSTAVLTLLTFLVIIISTLKRNISIGTHMAVASIGAGILSKIMKFNFERPRPTSIGRLIEIQGFSYPSGHSLAATTVYLTLAILSYTFFRTSFQKFIILVFACFLILFIGLSRVYLGVHYPTDVFAGIILGAAWAILLAGLISLYNKR